MHVCAKMLSIAQSPAINTQKSPNVNYHSHKTSYSYLKGRWKIHLYFCLVIVRFWRKSNPSLRCYIVCSHPCTLQQSHEEDGSCRLAPTCPCWCGRDWPEESGTSPWGSATLLYGLVAGAHLLRRYCAH